MRRAHSEAGQAGPAGLLLTTLSGLGLKATQDWVIRPGLHAISLLTYPVQVLKPCLARVAREARVNRANSRRPELSCGAGADWGVTKKAAKGLE
eukprot:6667457-Alexandrium_andersonii.AAC.1